MPDAEMSAESVDSLDPDSSTSGSPARPPLTIEAQVEIMRHGEIELEGRMRYSSNATFLARLDCDGEWARAVYKPRQGERPLWDFDTGTLCQREVAAYEVSRLTGFDLVPPTIMRDGPFGEGSFQLFIDHDPDDHFLAHKDEFADQFRSFAAFDVVVNNADRKSGHCIVDGDGRWWGIDHGVTFHVHHKLRTVIWEYIDEPLPARVVEGLEQLRARLRGAKDHDLEMLLAPVELDALQRRTDELLRAKRFPEPRTDYPYPWPLV